MLTTLVLALLACLFAMLGTWQEKRASEKAALEQQHRTAAPLSLEAAMEQRSRFASIDVGGHYDTTVISCWTIRSGKGVPVSMYLRLFIPPGVKLYW